MKATVRTLLFALAATVAVAGTARAELSDNDRAVYRDAYAAAKVNNWDQVWNLTQGASDKFPAKLLLWIELMRGGPEVQFAQYRDFISNNPTWPGLIVMRRHAERACRAKATRWPPTGSSNSRP